MTIKSSFQTGFRNAAYLSVGTLVAQVIGFVGFLFIARLFGPENYGIYATVMAFVMFFHLFVFNGLSKIIVREGSKDRQSFSGVLERTIGLRLLLAGAGVVLCVISSLFARYPLGIKLLIILFSTEIIYFGLDSFLGAIYQTTQRMEYLSYFSVATRLLVTGLSIAFLYLGAGIAVILAVNLASRFLVLTVSYFISRRFVPFRWSLRLHLDPVLMKGVFIFSLLGFINTFAVRIDVLMISFLSTSSDVGLYSVAHELGREGLMLRNIMATAFFPIAVQYFSQKNLHSKTLWRYAFLLGSAALLGSLLVFFFGESVVSLLFGQSYAPSGAILKVLVFYLPFTFFSMPFMTSLQATHNESVLLIIYSVTALTNIPLNLLFFFRFGLIGIAYSTIVVFGVEAVLVSIMAEKRMKGQGYLRT